MKPLPPIPERLPAQVRTTEAFEKQMDDWAIRLDSALENCRLLELRVDEHVSGAGDLLALAREEHNRHQDHPLKRLFLRRNQGKINAKIIGAVERDLAAIMDTRDRIRQIGDQLGNTSETLRNSLSAAFRECQEQARQDNEAIQVRLRMLDEQVSLLKELASMQHLEKRG